MKRRDFAAGLTLAATFGSAQAQQSAKRYRIAILDAASPVEVMNEFVGPEWPLWGSLFSELRRLGYVEGQNLTVERYSGRGNYSHDLARAVVASNPDLIFCVMDPRDLMTATDTIPIVTFLGAPTALVGSMARPGGNLTGFAFSPGIEIVGKRLALLREIVPRMSRVGILAVTWDRAPIEKYFDRPRDRSCWPLPQ